MKRLRIIGIVVVILMAGGLVIYLATPKEPSYGGRTVTAWLADYEASFVTNALKGQPRSPSPAMQASGRAVKEIGTNAIPTLLHLLKAKDSPIKIKLNSSLDGQHYIRFRFQTARQMQELAAHGFFLLGNDAKSAVPALVQFMQSQDSHQQFLVLNSLLSITDDQTVLRPLIIQSLHSSDQGLQLLAAGQLNIAFPGDKEKIGFWIEKISHVSKVSTTSTVPSNPPTAK